MSSGDIAFTIDVDLITFFSQLFSVIVFGSINAQGWHYKEKETCLYNGDANACNYGVGIGTGVLCC